MNLVRVGEGVLRLGNREFKYIPEEVRYVRDEYEANAGLKITAKIIDECFLCGGGRVHWPTLDNYQLSILKVIFNDPATIVFWSDGTKTIVKVGEDESFDKEKGLAMAISKKFLGTNESQSNFNNIFKKWIQ